ncbi:hypothetical protein MF672_033575 [Actinomadura sp. ATCC 31491]|uniref:DUF4244 domain-containing protein n=1 Tax=Actinomadura luzonensis TaxID=2805427 RepID=A0ABT0G254_9ACTN|nr:hypothetical protein [Actinomadura luzonensis]MCK2218690.1 hypothetical protein [Actinomadura luzonensis]
MNALDPVAVAAATVIALTVIAGVTAVLTVLLAVRGTPGARRAEIIGAVADLVRAVRGR